MIQVGVYAAGCSRGVKQKVDVSAGQYYSEAEFASLSASQRSKYCGQLTAEFDTVQADYHAKEKEIQDAKDLIQSIRQQIVPIEQEVLRLESDIRSVNDKIETVKALPTQIVVKEGDTLTLIAMRKDVYNDIDKWWKIFDANKSKIQDPWYIFPDTVLVIPRDWPTD